jgi:hypothetical protein
MTTSWGNKNKTNKRQRRRGGQATRCEAEVPQEVMQISVKANKRQMEGGVAGVT